MLVAFLSFFITMTLTYQASLDWHNEQEFAINLLVLLSTTALSFYFFKLYSGIVRYTSAIDSIRILSCVMFSFIITLLIKILFILSPFAIAITDTKFIILYSLFVFTGLVTYRTSVKIFFQYSKSSLFKLNNTVIYGAGDLGIAVKRTFDHDLRASKNIVAYIDDDESKIGKAIDGIKIYGTKDFLKLIDKLSIGELIIASHSIPVEKKSSIADMCLEHKVKVLTLPPVEQLIKGELSTNQIKTLKIEDLLQRSPIKISDDNIFEQLQGKRVLVTGAAGSIGSEIAKQLGKYKPQMVILCDQAESPLHNLQLDLRDLYREQIYHTFIGDVRNEKRMREMFETFKPHFVYHAAAYKHVPMMENHPLEAVLTNVKGSFILSNLAVEYKVKKFVFISTDKAVNPTNVMGGSKRIAEIYVQALNLSLQNKGGDHTRFITTRFGNVLGSNGSVIPRFRAQIEKGGPVTVTHPDITRYFMTIPEACQLVIEAGNMGDGGEIFVFDMGKSVKIIDLAEKMIKLSGNTPYTDVDIKFTGLRPGEKLYEELLNDLENTMPTHHEKIMIAKVRENDLSWVLSALNGLFEAADAHNNIKIVRHMKKIVPEFKSQNSIYEELDREIIDEKAQN